MAERKFDLVVLGAGPGGYAAAFAAADRGLKVALVNDEPDFGGTCLHRGCIPSKALLHIAKLLNEAREAAEWGIQFGQPQIDLPTLRSWKERVVGQLAGGVTQLCKKRGVERIVARGAFVASGRLRLTPAVDGIDELSFDKAIIATGSTPVIPPVFATDDPRVWDSTAALSLQAIPQRLLVVGGGYIGLELSTVYAALGSEVHLVEMQSGLLPNADRDLVRPLQRRLSSQLATIELETTVESLQPSADGIHVVCRGADGAYREHVFDQVLVSVGRRANTEGIGLENTDARRDERGCVQVDASRRTADVRIWAIGDAAGEPMLAHKATRDAKTAVESLVDPSFAPPSPVIPAVVFTDPEVAWCGLTDQEAKATQRSVKVVRYPWSASGRAQSLARTEGLTKLLCDPSTDQVLGVGIVGVGAGELIGEAALAIEMAATSVDLAETVHAHPTLSETLMEGAEAVHGQATHMYQRPR